ncbi:META domain-containing protein [Halothiobacillus sp. DCM-1]|uniref:META domain-containing protein n=1 Tax=Halothiobacillus sp. DCM-1 TaxID=3112558 RepID=UPI0032481ADC
MKRKQPVMTWVFAALLGIGLGGCAADPGATAADGHTSQIALDWAGGYTGEMPASGAQPARAVSLWLSPRNAYRLDLGDWGSRGMQSFTGKLTWQEGNRVNLVGAPPGLDHWQVREGGLKAEGAPALSLTQAPALVAVLALPSNWVLESLPGTVLPAGGKPPELSFAMTGRVAGFDGCNRLMGGFTQTGADGLSFQRLAGTMMACVQPDVPDRAFRAMLERVAHAKIQGEQLNLLDAKGQMIAQLRAVSSQALPSPSLKNNASRPD